MPDVPVTPGNARYRVARTVTTTAWERTNPTLNPLWEPTWAKSNFRTKKRIIFNMLQTPSAALPNAHTTTESPTPITAANRIRADLQTPVALPKNIVPGHSSSVFNSCTNDAASYPSTKR